ncbi:hypothetical protein BU26DRAFT_133650 [Trematosphaeria pertusa]|uniref:Uncharacterized protein n=1 Tax=Trematosphaeria pertusa TaxID=390896 RepID=A0A6A6HYE9_9PLEO|nr:uncharacterized protein BU26DRAFT_133650 [Trematosphaeria pertusa]KAF2242808.1 hypothetical protein BU26DRAFT_133650 [Trematosphaeria pertusa]
MAIGACFSPPALRGSLFRSIVYADPAAPVHSRLTMPLCVFPGAKHARSIGRELPLPWLRATPSELGAVLCLRMARGRRWRRWQSARRRRLCFFLSSSRATLRRRREHDFTTDGHLTALTGDDDDDDYDCDCDCDYCLADSDGPAISTLSARFNTKSLRSLSAACAARSGSAYFSNRLLLSPGRLFLGRHPLPSLLCAPLRTCSSALVQPITSRPAVVQLPPLAPYI